MAANEDGLAALEFDYKANAEAETEGVRVSVPPPVGASEAIGFLDGFTPPRHFFGWGAFQGVPASEQARIVIRIGDEIVAEGERTLPRPDVRTAAQPAGFAFEATRDIAHEEIAGGRLCVEIVDDERRGALAIPSHVTQRSRLFLALVTLAEHESWEEEAISALRLLIRGRDGGDGARRKMLATLTLMNEATPASFVADLANQVSCGVHVPRLPRDTRPSPEMSDLEVHAHFESLGFNCEFGFVQRHFQHEPTSLLRWAASPPEQLIEALRNDFAGVGEPEFTKFAPYWHDGEYATSDTRYDLTAHTTMRSIAPEAYEREFRKHCQRLSWLTRALLESFRDAAPIWVRVDYAPLSMPTIERLFSELRRYGPNRLLIVRADPAAEGVVERLGDGLAIGYVRTFSRWEAVDKYIDPASWMALLRNALAEMS
jgi:hypothetical protein